MYDVIPLNCLQHFKTAHIYHNYEHLAYNLYKHNSKHANTKPTKEDHQKTTIHEHTVENKRQP